MAHHLKWIFAEYILAAFYEELFLKDMIMDILIYNLTAYKTCYCVCVQGSIHLSSPQYLHTSYIMKCACCDIYMTLNVQN